MKLCVLIPAFNASKTIADLVRQVMQEGLDVLVVDDGSTDATAPLAESAGAKVLRNQENLGKGAALRRGFEYLLAQQIDAVITMDADGQHDPHSLKDFIEVSKETGYGVIIGNRMSRPEGMPFIRVLTNRFMSRLLSTKIGQPLSDTQCGFRLIKKEVLEQITLSTSDYEIESELLIKAAACGFKIGSVDIKSIYSHQKSRINPVADTWRFIRMLYGF